MLEKLYNGLNTKDKLVHKELTIDEKKKEIKKFFNLEQKTIDYLSVFIYSDDYFTLLYNAISGEEIKVTE